MKIFQIGIEETLSRTIEIIATSADEAIIKVKEMYDNEDIVLSASDFISSNISIID
jgi:hypothetical protein